MNKDEFLKHESNYINQSLDVIVSDRFSRYAKYIIQQRALPDARDGLKPVQRRILYSMNELNLFSNKSFKKSARVVGDVIGKYHPHGDSSIYEAMVRMAQDWKMNIPLIEMHGNKGSIDDDPAAAMRYTEVRLSKISELLLQNIKKNTVEFIPNFDDSEIEPMVLPSLFPNLLVNGAKGIAAGFATDMPPHNLVEVLNAVIAKLNNPLITIEEVSKFIKGPDFPTGGEIHGTQSIKDALKHGKGRIVLVSKYEIVDKQIIISEIPYGVIKSKLVRQIDEIIQLENIDGLLEVRDESSRVGIKIVIDISNTNKAKKIIDYLIKKTELQIYYNYNNIAIDNFAPKLMNVLDLIDSFLKHVSNIQRKTFLFDLNKAKSRLEILLGFIKLTNISDQVIELIRKSDGSKVGVINNLVKMFDFTFNQAEAIANLRLYRLSKTDVESYYEEKAQLEQEIAKLENYLNNKNSFNQYLINQFSDIQKEYGTKRKTKIHTDDLELSVNVNELLANELVVVGVSKNGYLKRMSTKVAQSNELSFYFLNDEDSLLFLNKVYSNDKLLIFTNHGNFISLPVHKIEEQKWKTIGVHLNTLSNLEIGEEIVKVIPITEFDKLTKILMISKLNYAKKTTLEQFNVSRYNKMQKCFKFKNDKDELLDAYLVNDSEKIILTNQELRLYNLDISEVKDIDLKLAGQKLINSFDNQKYYFTAFNAYHTNSILVFLSNKGYIRKLNNTNLQALFREAFKENTKTYLSKQIKTIPHKIIRIFNFRETQMDQKLILKTIDNLIEFNANEIKNNDDSFKNIDTKDILEAFKPIDIIEAEKDNKNTLSKDIPNNKSFNQSSSNSLKESNKKEKINYADISSEELDEKFNKSLEAIDNLETFDIDDILKKIS